MMKIKLTVFSILLLVALMMQTRPAKADPSVFTKGDVFAAVGNGKVNWYHPDGTLNHVLDTGVGGLTTGMGFDADGNLYVTNFAVDRVSKFDTSGNLLGTFGNNYGDNPESIVFDLDGNVYVGHAGPELSSPTDDRAIHKYDAVGQLLARFEVQTDDRGSDWIDLAADQCTMFYTSEGREIKRYDVCTAQQLPDFVSDLDGTAYALRLLSDGGLLVAKSNNILQLDGSGNIIQTYDAPGEDDWFALNRDPDGTSFWSGNVATGNFYKFDIATGNLLLGPITACDPNPRQCLGGLAVFGELTAAINADLSLAMAGDTSVNVGDDVAMEVLVTNHGPDDTTGVVLTMTLPVNTVFISATPEQGACQDGGGNLVCELGDLTNQDTVSVEVMLNAVGVGEITAMAEVISKKGDPDASNNIASLTTTAIAVDLNISVSSQPNPITVGDELVYQITITNQGPFNATDVVVDVTLPDNETIPSGSSEQEGCTGTSGHLRCQLGELANETTKTITVTGIPSIPGESSSTFVVTSSEHELNPADNSVTDIVIVTSADLSIAISHEPEKVKAEESFDYLLTIENRGPFIATGVVVTDALPSSLQFVSTSSEQGQCNANGNTITCALDQLGIGEKRTIRITVLPETHGIVTNQVRVLSSEFDPMLVNNIATQEFKVGRKLVLWWFLLPLFLLLLLAFFWRKRPAPAPSTTSKPTNREAIPTRESPQKRSQKRDGADLTHNRKQKENRE